MTYCVQNETQLQIAQIKGVINTALPTKNKPDDNNGSPASELLGANDGGAVTSTTSVIGTASKGSFL